MACFLYAARRFYLVLLAVFVLSNACFGVIHSSEVIKPSFLFSPLAYCAAQSRYQEKDTEQTGFHFQCSPFITKNFSKQLIGAGLGAGTNNTFIVGPAKLGATVDSDHLIAILTKDADPYLQKINETTYRPQATLTLNPEHKTIGINFVLRHDLDAFCEGLFYTFEASLVDQQRTIGGTYANEQQPRLDNADIISIHDFFTGQIQSIYDPLASLKLPNTVTRQKGCDLVQATIGYHIVDKNAYRLTLQGSVQLPCGPDHSLENLFAPNIGVKHLQIGLGWHGHLKLGGNKTTAWHLSNIAMGSYSFPANEIRIPTIANMPWAHYYQMMAHKSPLTMTLTPGPDMLPRSIKVKQGLSFQDTFIMSYQHKETCLDVGFSAAYREAEHNCLTSAWADNTVGIPNRYLNIFNFVGASNSPEDQTYLINGKMYPHTAGQLPESLSTTIPPTIQTFTLGTNSSGEPVTMTPATTGAWMQAMTTKVINNADLELNHPTLFLFQVFASFARVVTISDKARITINAGCNLEFGQPQELLMRTYQLWLGVGGSF